MRASYFWALLILVAIGGWLSSGELIVSGQGGGTAIRAEEAADAETAPGADAADVPATDAPAEEETPFAVQVRRSRAEDRQTVLVLRGHTQADRRVTVRAQTPGLVEEVAVRKGDRVAAGDLLCRVEDGNRTAVQLRAEASLAQAQQDYDAASRLNEKGFAAETRLRQAKAALDAAKASLSEAQLDLGRTEIRAPFAGLVEALPAEVGALLAVGEPCAELMSVDPMLAFAEVPERSIREIEPGMTGKVELVTGQRAEGEIAYIATAANVATRTFRIELKVPNPEGALRDGVTATVRIPLQTTEAHFFSPAVLTLDEKGVVGVRVVDEQDVVRFLPVTLVADEPDGVWVSGLPPEVTLITVGQEYVREGETVSPVRENAEAAR